MCLLHRIKGIGKLSDSITANPKEIFLHVLPNCSQNLIKYLKENKDCYTEVLGIWQTGWTYSEKIDKLQRQRHYLRSMQSVFSQFLRPKKIIPTVNVSNASSREKMQSFFRERLKDT
ncbi:hypothetical protein MLD38_013568 [Melastoma candidum]|uniref:Uncharacterized protein n=1 Tax=Melastoma candidum TaxID=119954 RepID=A0ACB9R9E8_9MYRT|nr:hypothetical protein MLD38_013568 [Melastoma candidum]